MGVEQQKIINAMFDQVHFLLRRRVPLVEALEISRQSIPPFPKIVQVYDDLIARVKRGERLSAALARYPHLFGNYFIALVTFGEDHDCLETSLQTLGEERRRDQEMKTMVTAAITYPAIMGLVAGSVVLFLLIFVIPTFVKMFNDVGLLLPLPTRIVIAVSAGLREQWFTALTLAGLAVGAGFALWSTSGGDRLLRYVPFLGRLVVSLRELRAGRVILTAIRLNLPLVAALNSFSTGLPPSRLKAELTALADQLQRGSTLSAAVAERPLFSRLTAWVIAAGEKTGTLGDNLDQLLRFKEAQARQHLAIFTNTLEPFFILVNGVMVGLIAMSLFLPIFSLSALVWQ